MICCRGRRKCLVLDMHLKSHLGTTKALAAIKLKWYDGITGLARRLVQECMACRGTKALLKRIRAAVADLGN